MQPMITKESAAWREAALRIERGDVSFLYGICFLLCNMRGAGVIDRELLRDMEKRIEETFREKAYSGWADSGSYLYPHSEPDERILLCLFLALLAEDEGR